jgi:hypothetical protein
MGKHLREQRYPVFPDDVLIWASEAIEGTVYASYFPYGKPTRGWYNGWLRRMEQTRADWYTAKNLPIYFDVSKDVL